MRWSTRRAQTSPPTPPFQRHACFFVRFAVFLVDFNCVRIHFSMNGDNGENTVTALPLMLLFYDVNTRRSRRRHSQRWRTRHRSWRTSSTNSRASTATSCRAPCTPSRRSTCPSASFSWRRCVCVCVLNSTVTSSLGSVHVNVVLLVVMLLARSKQVIDLQNASPTLHR